VQKALIDDWRYATEDVSNRAMPRVTNSDGDPFSPTSDYFDIVTSDIDTLLSAIADIPGVEASEPRNKRPAFVITKANNAQSDEWNNTVIGTVLVSRRTLQHALINSPACFQRISKVSSDIASVRKWEAFKNSSKT
jgi:hypothetical protein